MDGGSVSRDNFESREMRHIVKMPREHKQDPALESHVLEHLKKIATGSRVIRQDVAH